MSKQTPPKIEPRPAELNRKLAMLQALVRDIGEDYAWTHGWANNRSRSGDTLGGKTPDGVVNDEVGTLVVSSDKESARTRMRIVAANVDEALSILRSARFQLQDAIKQRDPMPSVTGPALATRLEKRDGYAAKLRRGERGEDIPE